MEADLVSPDVFKWILTVLTGGLAGTWLVYDSISLIRSLSPSRRVDPLAHDKRFGYVMGIAIGIIGLWGCLRFHGLA